MVDNVQRRIFRFSYNRDFYYKAGMKYYIIFCRKLWPLKLFLASSIDFFQNSNM